MRFTWASQARVNSAKSGPLNGQMQAHSGEQPMTAFRRLALAGSAGAALVLLGGCVVAPPAYGPYGYGEGAVVAPAVVAPPVSVGIGIGGYYGGRPYYGRPGYWGRGYWGGRPYWR